LDADRSHPRSQIYPGNKRFIRKREDRSIDSRDCAFSNKELILVSEPIGFVANKR
jgi:hypothetical protein